MLLILLSTLFIHNSSTACETQSNLSLSKAIYKEINLARRSPLSYAQLAEKQWKNSSSLKRASIALCKSKNSAHSEFKKVIRLLKQQSPSKAYGKNSLLNLVACDITVDMAKGDRVNPLYENYSRFFASHLTIKNYTHGVSVSSGMTNARDIVLRFLLGDCQFKISQGKKFTKDNIFWKNVFSNEFEQMGTACNHHPLSEFDSPQIMCAQTVIKKGKAKRIKKGYQKGFEEL